MRLKEITCHIAIQIGQKVSAAWSETDKLKMTLKPYGVELDLEGEECITIVTISNVQRMKAFREPKKPLKVA